MSHFFSLFECPLSPRHENNSRFTAKLIYDEPSDIEMGKRGLEDLLTRHEDIDAIYCSNDAVAIGAQLHCLAADISVPVRLAIGAFSGLELGQMMPQRLTTVRSKRFEVGQRSAHAILQRLDGKRTPRIHDLGFEFIDGQTT